jgi:hypothetical protein
MELEMTITLKEKDIEAAVVAFLKEQGYEVVPQTFGNLIKLHYSEGDSRDPRERTTYSIECRVKPKEK